MSQVIIGIDPDSEKYGVSVFESGELVALYSKDVIDLRNLFAGLRLKDLEVTVVIEDIISNGFIYSRHNKKQGASVRARIAQNVGMCKQAQKTAEHFADHFGFKLIRIPPQLGNWAKNKKLFEKVTGWKMRSNEDTRSAAYFGWLYVSKKSRLTRTD